MRSTMKMTDETYASVVVMVCAPAEAARRAKQLRRAARMVVDGGARRGLYLISPSIFNISLARDSCSFLFSSMGDRLAALAIYRVFRPPVLSFYRPFSSTPHLSIKKRMPPKKAAAQEKKILLGRPGNNLKIGIVGLFFLRLSMRCPFPLLLQVFRTSESHPSLTYSLKPVSIREKNSTESGDHLTIAQIFFRPGESGKFSLCNH